MNKIIKKQFAFTLIELLVVIAIIGILSALIVVGMSSTTQKATIAKGQVFSNSLRNSLMGNLVSEWKFDNITDYNSGTKVIGTSSNNISDSWGASGYNHGTASGGPILKEGNDCVSGKCIQFDRTDDYVDCGNGAGLDIIGDITLETWFFANNVTPRQDMLDKHQYNVGGYAIRLEAGSIIFLVDTPNQSSLTFSAGIVNNRWNHITITLSGNTAVIYLDGINKISSSALASPKTTVYHFYIGRSFNGQMDEVRIYNAAIPTSQIQQNYFAGINKLFAKNQINQIDYQQRLAELSSTYAKE
ncbi:MAG: LamG-like jellyroll fold domain-containing protein [Candidatus Paceibacterota bacterium]